MVLLRRIVIVGMMGLLVGGCSIKHRVAADYEKYLINNEGEYNYPKTDYEAEYMLTRNTIDHHLEFRAVSVGYANLWIVDFGDILETTLQSKDVQAAFRKLSAAGEGDPSGNIQIKYNLISYEFKGFEARIKLQVIVYKKGEQVFDKTYFEKGKSQGAKMGFGGVFAMKNAIQQSTKGALDKILDQSIKDLLGND